MDNDDAPYQQEDEALRRHQALSEVLEGKRELTWDIWASRYHESSFLTADGRSVAAWAVDVLRKFLGEDFLRRLREAHVEHPLLSPAIFTSLWPEIDSRRVYEDLFRLAAQLRIGVTHGKRWRELQTSLRRNFDTTSWTHNLIQFELASLAQRHGWECEFEAKLSTGKRGDVRLEQSGEAIAIEVTSVGTSVPQQVAEAFFHEVTMRFFFIEAEHNVRIKGAIGDVVPLEELDSWLIAIKKAAQSTAYDKRERFVPGPAEAAVWVSTEELSAGETHLEGPAGPLTIWERIQARIALKGRKTVGSGATWIRLQDYGGLWLSLLSSQTTSAERFIAVAPQLRLALDLFPHVDGIVLSPGPMWVDNEPVEQTIVLREMPGTMSLRRPYAQSQVRETIIVCRPEHMDIAAKTFLEWYGQESSWLEWAFEQIGLPKLDALFKNPEDS